MALPLPQPSPGGFTLGALREGNAFTNDLYRNQIAKAEAQYAPQQAYANALLARQQAQWLPYQYQMQALSNPLLWMTAQNNPELQKQLFNMMSNPMKMDNGSNTFGIPEPKQDNGLLGALFDKLGINQNSNNALNQDIQNPGILSPNAILPNANQQMGQMPQTQVTGSPLVPASQGGVAGVLGKMTAPYNVSPYGKGSLIPDPNNPGRIISTPTETTITETQRAINAAKRVAPQLKELAKAAEPFLTAQGLGKTAKEGFQNFFMGAKNVSPSDYAKYRALIKSSPEALVKAYGLRPTNETISRMQGVIEPILGENGQDYYNRIMKTLEQLDNEQVGISKEQLQQGFSTAPENEEGIENFDLKGKNKKSEESNQPSEEDIEFTAKKYGITKEQVKQYLGI